MLYILFSLNHLIYRSQAIIMFLPPQAFYFNFESITHGLNTNSTLYFVEGTPLPCPYNSTRTFPPHSPEQNGFAVTLGPSLLYSFNERSGSSAWWHSKGLTPTGPCFLIRCSLFFCALSLSCRSAFPPRTELSSRFSHAADLSEWTLPLQKKAWVFLALLPRPKWLNLTRGGGNYMGAQFGCRSKPHTLTQPYQQENWYLAP